MNERRLIVRMSIVVAMAALANSAFASLQIETAQYGSSDIGSSVSLSIPQFNTDAGQWTLNEVTIVLSANDTISSLVYNANPSSATFTYAIATMPVTLTGPDGLSAMAMGSVGPFNGVLGAFSLAVNTKSTDGSAEDSVNVTQGNASPFEGIGDVTLTVLVGPTGSYSGSAGSSVFFGGTGSSSGTVEIDYTYSSSDGVSNLGPDSVPEPGTLCAGLALISICGIEIARRFRRILARA